MPFETCNRNPSTERVPRDRGASLVEYALLVTLIALVCFAAVTFFGTQTSSSFDRTGQSIHNAPN